MIDADSFLRDHPVASSVPSEEVSAAPPHAESESKIGEEDDGDRCMESALRSLDAAGTSEAGLRKRLEKKEYSDASIEKVIATLKRMQLLDDEAFGRGVLNRCLDKCMGAFGAQRELASKGIEPVLARNLVEQASQQGLFEESARKLVESVDRKTHGMDYQKRLRRLAATAQRKGHSMSEIRRLGAFFFEK